MTDTVTYAERWSELEPGPVDPIDPEEARRRHESGQLYTAVLGGPEHPTAYLDVRLDKGFVGVHFLDEDGRNDLTYLFGKREGDDRLFLERATWRTYGDDGEVAAGESYFFDRDGTVHLERKDYIRREAERGEKQDDVSGNWEPVPEFGEFDSIARRER